MELDDDMILVIVGDDDSPNILGSRQHVHELEKEGRLSDKRVLSQTDPRVPIEILDENGLLDSIKEEPFDFVGTIKVSEDHQLEYCSGNVHEATQTSVGPKKAHRRHSRMKKPSRKGKKKRFVDSDSSDDFIPPSSWHKPVRRTKPILKAKKSDKELKNCHSPAVNSNTKIPPSLDSKNDETKSKPKPKPKSKETALEKNPIIKKEVEDTAVSIDDNARSIASPNTNIHVTELEEKFTKENSNDLHEDSDVKPEDDIGYFIQFQNPRRCYHPNPKSYVAKLIKQRPELADDSEALVDALVEVMRQVRPPDPPRDYYIMNNVNMECVQCGQLSETFPAASRHYHEKHGPRYLICFACGVDFRSTTNLYRHEKRCIARDAGVVLRARARLLGARARSRPFLQSERRARRGPGPRPEEPPKPPKQFPCTLCSATFLSQQGLSTHTNYHMGRRPYVCEECGRAYTSRCALTKHRRNHTDELYICDHCGRSFKAKSTITVHMVSHQPLRPYACAECPRRLGSRAALRRHARSRHRRLPPPCACALCHRRFPRMWSLKQHMHQEHGLSLMTKNMFYKQLPTMTETQLMVAKVIANSDFDSIVTADTAADAEKPPRVGAEATDCGPQGEQDAMECDRMLQENVDSDNEVKVLNDGGKGIVIEVASD